MFNIPCQEVWNLVALNRHKHFANNGMLIIAHVRYFTKLLSDMLDITVLNDVFSFVYTFTN